MEQNNKFNKWTAALIVALAVLLAFWSAWSDRQKVKEDKPGIITPPTINI